MTAMDESAPIGPVRNEQAPTRVVPFWLKVWGALLAAVALALAIYPFQPFTGSLGLIVGVFVAIALGGLALARALAPSPP
jgi:hypothetical protein